MLNDIHVFEYLIDETDLQKFNDEYQKLQTDLKHYNNQIYGNIKDFFAKKLRYFALIMNQHDEAEFRHGIDGVELELENYNQTLTKHYHEIFFFIRKLLLTKLDEYKKILNKLEVNDLDEDIDSLFLYTESRPNTREAFMKHYEKFLNKIRKNKSSYLYEYFRRYLQSKLYEFIDEYAFGQCACNNIPCNQYGKFMNENDLFLFRT